MFNIKFSPYKGTKKAKLPKNSLPIHSHFGGQLTLNFSLKYYSLITKSLFYSLLHLSYTLQFSFVIYFIFLRKFALSYVQEQNYY